MKTLKEHQYTRSLEEFLKRCDQEQVMIQWIRNNFGSILSTIPNGGASEIKRFIGVGCGNGIMDVEMLKIASCVFPNVQSTCIDPNKEELNIFKKRVEKESSQLNQVNIQWVQSTAEKYQEGKSTDINNTEPVQPIHLIHMLHMLYHVTSIEGAIEKYYNQLVEDGILLITIASRTNNQLYNTFKKFETLQSNSGKTTGNVERNDKRYSDDVIDVLKRLGYSYDVENVSYSLDVSGCLEQKTKEGELLLDFVCLTNASRHYDTLSEENRKMLVECLKESCETDKDGKILVKLTFDVITVRKRSGCTDLVNGTT